MMIRLRILAILVPIAADLAGAADGIRAEAWVDAVSLPSYPLGTASANPQFPIYTHETANYPYPLLKTFTQQREVRAWRTLNLENQFLACRVLPDIGGHLYGCKDKRSGREMFYANPVIKPADIGLRGAWDALGIESNFPIGHTRDSISKVDYAVSRDPDGSARAIV